MEEIKLSAHELYGRYYFYNGQQIRNIDAHFIEKPIYHCLKLRKELKLSKITKIKHAKPHSRLTNKLYIKIVLKIVLF